jgi:hypothetical protein
VATDEEPVACAEVPYAAASTPLARADEPTAAARTPDATLPLPRATAFVAFAWVFWPTAVAPVPAAETLAPLPSASPFCESDAEPFPMAIEEVKAVWASLPPVPAPAISPPPMVMPL